MVHPLPKNVYSSRLVSTLAITTHPPRCCEDRARLVADKLANGKEPKEAARGGGGCAIAIAMMGRRPPEMGLQVKSTVLPPRTKRNDKGGGEAGDSTLNIYFECILNVSLRDVCSRPPTAM